MTDDRRQSWSGTLRDALFALGAVLLALQLPAGAATSQRWSGSTGACGFSASGSSTIYRLELAIDGDSHQGRVILHNIFGKMWGPFSGVPDADGHYRRGIKLGYADFADLVIRNDDDGVPQATVNGCAVGGQSARRSSTSQPLTVACGVPSSALRPFAGADGSIRFDMPALILTAGKPG